MKSVLLSFWKSQNKWVYLRIAFRYGISPGRVYGLAHGRRSKGKKENLVLKELQKQGVISDVKDW